MLVNKINDQENYKTSGEIENSKATFILIPTQNVPVRFYIIFTFLQLVYRSPREWFVDYYVGSKQ